MLTLVAFAACSSSSSNPGEEGQAGAGPDAGCANIAGDWSFQTCDDQGDCKVIQAGCTASIGCQNLWGTVETADGIVSGNTVTFTTDAGTCTGEFLSTVASGSCQSPGTGGSCSFTATKK